MRSQHLYFSITNITNQWEKRRESTKFLKNCAETEILRNVNFVAKWLYFLVFKIAYILMFSAKIPS